MKRISKLIPVVISLLVLQGCQSTFNPAKNTAPSKVNIKNSYLVSDGTAIAASKHGENEEQTSQKNGQFQRVNQLADARSNVTLEVDLSKSFSQVESIQVAVNGLPLNDFLHYALGELLGVSYLIESSVKSNTAPVTLELKNKVSPQRLFQLVQEVLAQNNVSLQKNNDVYYVFPRAASGQKNDRAFGFGRKEGSVPNVSSEIVQLVPIKYGVSPGLRNSIAGLVDANVAIDPSQSLMTLRGKRPQILRALTLIELIDSPTLSNKAIALMDFTYIDSQTFVTKVSELLEKEGVQVAAKGGKTSSLQFVPIEHLGKVVVFATADEIIDRVEYWGRQLDKPASGSEQSFFVYHPKYARALDLGQSLAPLLGSSVNTQSSNTAQKESSNNGSVNKRQNSSFSIENDGLKLVVDERANALIFYSTGSYYQELQPILKQLDVMPKQVMMEVIIAEVKLTGSFAKGVQFALESGGASSRNEKFSYSSKEGFKYSIVGLPGTVDFSLNQTDGLVNVLSRPTLLVRDGVSASISVGDDIPTAGSTISDPINSDRETTTIQYRKTGVTLNVTPTVNAQGTVIMTIEQSISDVNPDAAGSSETPAIFERSISTEVVAGNGQTVLLGGLISNRKTNGGKSVPLLGDVPVLGHLFRADSSSSDKTELVVLVTPRIIQNRSDWLEVEQSFKTGLENLTF